AVAFPVHFKGAGRAEHGGPLDFIEGRADIGHGAQQNEIFDVENAGGFVGALELATEAAEVPAFAVGHGGVRQAHEEVAGQLHLIEEIVRRLDDFAAGAGGIDHQIIAIELKPHLGGDHFADGAGVFAGGAEAGDDGIGIVPVEGQEVDDVVLGGGLVTLGELDVVAGDIDNRLPLLVLAARRIEHEVEVDVDETRDIFRAFDVAAHPVNRIRDTAEHQVGTPATWVAAPLRMWSASAALVSGFSASTQVSLLPPPCEELTTSDPFLRATRVRPPGRTKISLP